MKFIDLFAGIGGFRIALEEVGHKCVFSAEINDHACRMYEENFGENPFNDITKLEPSTIPDFDILCAGFPCQSFSISGKQEGFKDARGTLFFDICRIIDVKRPKVVLLENVANLEKHDGGRTLNVILNSLVSLGYNVSYEVLNAIDFGLPQNRSRIFIVATLDFNFDFSKIEKSKKITPLKNFINLDNDSEILDEKTYTLINNAKLQKSGLIFAGYRNKNIRTAGVRENTEHLSRVHKQPNRIYSADGVSPTIASQETAGRNFVLYNGVVKKMSIEECYRIFGFPENFKKIGPKTQLYERIGNSVCIPVVKGVAMEITKQMSQKIKNVNKPQIILENAYDFAKKNSNNWRKKIQILDSEDIKYLMEIVDHEETSKGVYTVLITSLVKKIDEPKQDVRLHQISIKGGYSGRSYDTKYITPFLKSKNFRAAMKESGWLTRSLEQASPYTLDFKGKITPIDVKKAFLHIMDVIQKNQEKSEAFLHAIFSESYYKKLISDRMMLVTPIKKDEKLPIDNIIKLIWDHFNYKYSARGKSILPIIAIYSIYECIMGELKRFDDCKLKELASHYSSDRSSNEVGDITINKNGVAYEALEIKSEIIIDADIVNDVFKKIKSSSVKRYYILSTTCDRRKIVELEPIISKIRNEHGCQVIVNGVFDTLRYYLRLLSNSDLFVERYMANMEKNKELPVEFKMAWNKIVSKK